MEKKPDVVIAAETPIQVHLNAGQEYLYCTCGLSGGQPFCDQSHFGTTHAGGMPFTAVKSGPALLCRCKHTDSAPFATVRTRSSELGEKNTGQRPVFFSLLKSSLKGELFGIIKKKAREEEIGERKGEVGTGQTARRGMIQ